jgi:hypothetical protein
MVDQIQSIQQDISELAGRPISLLGAALPPTTHAHNNRSAEKR